MGGRGLWEGELVGWAALRTVASRRRVHLVCQVEIGVGRKEDEMRKLMFGIGLGAVLLLACSMHGDDAHPQQGEWCMAHASRVQQYNIVTASDIKTLKDRVTDAIAHGWQPAGGVAIAQEGLCQVIVK